MQLLAHSQWEMKEVWKLGNREVVMEVVVVVIKHIHKHYNARGDT